MATNPGFTQKFAASIVAVLGCHDRLIFKGYLPFGGDGPLNAWVDGTLHLRRKDFLPFVERQSEALVEHAKQLAQAAGAPYHYLQGRHNKEDLIRQQLQERRLDEGLVAVLCCQETCRTVKLRQGEGRPRLTFARRPQRVL